MGDQVLHSIDSTCTIHSLVHKEGGVNNFILNEAHHEIAGTLLSGLASYHHIDLLCWCSSLLNTWTMTFLFHVETDLIPYFLVCVCMHNRTVVEAGSEKG